jgi:hypothetical protein
MTERRDKETSRGGEDRQPRARGIASVARLDEAEPERPEDLRRRADDIARTLLDCPSRVRAAWVEEIAVANAVLAAMIAEALVTAASSPRCMIDGATARPAPPALADDR